MGNFEATLTYVCSEKNHLQALYFTNGRTHYFWPYLQVFYTQCCVKTRWQILGWKYHDGDQGDRFNPYLLQLTNTLETHKPS